MKIWIEPSALSELPDHTVSGELGGSVMFVYWNRLLHRWEWVLGGGKIEVIPEPKRIFVEEEWMREHLREIEFDGAREPKPVPSSLPFKKKRRGQLNLPLEMKGGEDK
jgi:hypothetical protein